MNDQKPETPAPLCQCGHHKNYLCHSKNPDIASASNCCCGGYEPGEAPAPQAEKLSHETFWSGIRQTYLCCACSFNGSLKKALSHERESQPSRTVEEVAKEWWDKHQDDFVDRVAGTGPATHSLYDTLAALAAFYRYAKERGL